jgi:hypothetical protein
MKGVFSRSDSIESSTAERNVKWSGSLGVDVIAVDELLSADRVLETGHFQRIETIVLFGSKMRVVI